MLFKMAAWATWGSCPVPGSLSCTGGMCVGACVQSFSHVRFFVMSWTVAHQASLSMKFSRQEYWSLLPCPPPGEPSQPRERNCISRISCTGRRVLYHRTTWKAYTEGIHAIKLLFAFLLLICLLKWQGCLRWFMSMYDKNHYNLVK